MRIAVTLLLVVGLIGAAAPTVPSAEEQVRAANEALERGDLDLAASLFADAAERTEDPGMVAFNRAALHFARGEFREAELDYRRALDDAEAPPERRAKAWYNRGTALLNRGGSMEVYHSAIACFDRSLASGPDDGLKSDLRHNLELAKLLWAEERKKLAKPKSANESSPEEHETHSSKRPTSKDGADSTPNEKKGPPEPRPPGQVQQAPGSNPQETSQPTPGAGNLQPVLDTAQPQPINPEDLREHLRRTAERLDRDRKSLLQSLYGRDRPGVKDW